ncbi:MAG: heme exporter protein CcmB [Anaerolineae bacterium]
MNRWRGITAILRKDIVTELRSKETLSSLSAFALMVIVIFNFAFELRVDNVRQIAPGVLWVALTFAGVLAFNRSFLLEREEGCIDGLMLTPMDRSVIYVGKLLANILFMLLAEALILPVFAALFDVSMLNIALWLILLLGTIGFAAAGTLFAAMAVNIRAREVMLPILLFPIAVPVFIAATKSTAQILDGQPISEIYIWLRLLLAFDVIFIVIALLSFEYVLEE